MTDREKAHQLSKELTDRLSAEGRLIEGGWKAYEYLVLPAAASTVQRTETRKAYFAGAQHLFASLLTILDPDTDATAKDLKRMDLINAELEKFTEELRRDLNRLQ